MSMDPTFLFLSLIPGAIGLVLFGYGKKQGRWPYLVGGLLLMVYPYFTPDVMSLTLAGGAIGGALWFALRQDW